MQCDRTDATSPTQFNSSTIWNKSFRSSDPRTRAVCTVVRSDLYPQRRAMS